MPGRASYAIDRLVLARFAALIGAAVMIGGGCGGHAQGAAYAEVDTPVVFSSPPTLVEVDAGVWVVRDYDYPVYFVDDDYWVVREGVWYRSHAYEGGWVRIEENVVPLSIARRNHHVYVHYHGVATAHTRPAPRRERGPEPHPDHPEHPDHPDHPEHAGEHHGPPHHDDSPGHSAPGHEGDHHGADQHNAPPAHAAQQHGAPPGHDEHQGNKDKKQNKSKDKGKETKH